MNAVLGGSFLAGASGRLLPASIPFRYFGAAAVYHVLGWLALAASDWIDFAGGLGWPLAALHLFTLGVLGMTALGAGAQLLPVATRQAVIGSRWMAAVWWLYTPGVAVLTLGMGIAQPPLLAAGAALVAVALGLWGVLIALHLRRARGMPGVLAHVAGALVCLALLLASALSLSGTWLGWAMPSRQSALAWHVLFAPFGFMGLLVLGLSYILVPMFALADVPPERRQLLSCGLAVTALALAAVAVLGVATEVLVVLALLAALAAVSLHLVLMRAALRSGMRKHLGRPFVLVRVAWVCMAASPLLAAAVVFELPLPRAPAWLALVLVGGWLLTFLMGILQRILPFLGGMHVPQGAGRRASAPSALTHEQALRWHFRCHGAALAGSALALLSGSSWLAALSAGIGAIGAIAFGIFYAHVLRRIAPLNTHEVRKGTP
jgi:hypothetical protein